MQLLFSGGVRFKVYLAKIWPFQVLFRVCLLPESPNINLKYDFFWRKNAFVVFFGYTFAKWYCLLPWLLGMSIVSVEASVIRCQTFAFKQSSFLISKHLTGGISSKWLRREKDVLILNHTDSILASPLPPSFCQCQKIWDDWDGRAIIAIGKAPSRSVSV